MAAKQAAVEWRHLTSFCRSQQAQSWRRPCLLGIVSYTTASTSLAGSADVGACDCVCCVTGRQLYFINSYYAMPSIMTLSTDGQKLAVLIGSELQSPSALTIDFNMGGRLFWVDKHRNVIESCTADGADRTVMFTQQPGSCCSLYNTVYNGSLHTTVN